MNTKILTFSTFFAAGILAIATLPAHAVIIQYDANPGPAPDPDSVDADLVTGGTQSWSGGLASDSAVNSGGTHAWQTVDLGFSPLYAVEVPSASVTELATDGFVLRWNVQALVGTSGGYAVNQGMSLLYTENDISDLWRLDLGVEADGDQQVRVTSRVASGPEVFSSPYIADGEGEIFHLYELVYDPGSLTADLFVDGVERISNFAGPSIGNAGGGVQVRWGDGSGGTNPDRIANHNLIQLDTAPDLVLVPEPSTLTLATLGFLVLLKRRKRRLLR